MHNEYWADETQEDRDELEDFLAHIGFVPYVHKETNWYDTPWKCIKRCCIGLTLVVMFLTLIAHPLNHFFFLGQRGRDGPYVGIFGNQTTTVCEFYQEQNKTTIFIKESNNIIRMVYEDDMELFTSEHQSPVFENKPVPDYMMDVVTSFPIIIAKLLNSDFVTLNNVHRGLKIGCFPEWDINNHNWDYFKNYLNTNMIRDIIMAKELEKLMLLMEIGEMFIVTPNGTITHYDL
uniref:Protein croquemort-like n=1 Tax=Rhabditophanes sp. KR3021 TaxID=114890 RepID=A0AC35TQY3_9BILA